MTDKNEPEDEFMPSFNRFKRRIAKKPPEWWISIWQDIAVAAFFAGILLSAHFCKISANKALNEAIEEMIEKNPCLMVYDNDMFPPSVNISGYTKTNIEQPYDDTPPDK